MSQIYTVIKVVTAKRKADTIETAFIIKAKKLWGMSETIPNPVLNIRCHYMRGTKRPSTMSHTILSIVFRAMMTKWRHDCITCNKRSPSIWKTRRLKKETQFPAFTFWKNANKQPTRSDSMKVLQLSSFVNSWAISFLPLLTAVGSVVRWHNRTWNDY